MYYDSGTMPTRNTDAKPRHDRGRARMAGLLIAIIEMHLPPGHPARKPLDELKGLFQPPVAAGTRDVRKLLDRVPGDSIRTKAARIGISKNTVFNLMHGRFSATPETIQRIKAAIEAD